MIKRILFLAFLIIPGVLSAQTIPILSARAQPLGSSVTVRGIVTNGSELGKIRYLQDGSAGIAAYPGTGSAPGFEAAVSAGDSIEVTGTLVSYFGLLEITPITSYSVIVGNLPLPAPKPLKLSEISAAYEGQLVGFECVVFTEGGGSFSGSGGYSITDADGQSGKVYLQNGHPIIGTVIPGTPINLTSILSNFNGFQLLPRTSDDFSHTPCFYFTDPLEQTNITTTGFHLTWGTNLDATTKLHYGTSPALGLTVDVAGISSAQGYDLIGLQPGTVYWVQVESAYNGNVILSKRTPFTTKSLSSGQVKVFFNRSIDASFANGFSPEGESIAAVLAETIARINAAQQTLDVAMYNNNRSDLTNAVKAAHNRGVRVRYVAALDASNTALNPLPAFPVIFGNSEAIMHDKFLVIDADLPDNAWVMSGSLNWTNQNINNDFNNTLFIQDQSLARAYELEFEEMWGGDSSLPIPQNSRFASSKRDDTPHHFIIGDRVVGCWFSPSDRTTDRIVETIYTADEEALFATYSFTKNEMGDALVDAFNNHIAVRGMIENISDPGCEIDYLTAVGIDCRPHTRSGDLHHKYGVFDANGSDPIVVTGSHNWTFSAETVNDENTLIIHDYRLASLYKAEFEARWQENSVATYSPKNQEVKLFPNPVSAVLNVSFATEDVQEIVIRNILGEVVFVDNIAAQMATKTLNLQQLPAGQYFAFILTQHELFAVPFQKI
jgi:phosphatidylserine/phosphatidylglycerophosphate/cardiolipin synthase-like enzyme